MRKQTSRHGLRLLGVVGLTALGCSGGASSTESSLAGGAVNRGGASATSASGIPSVGGSSSTSSVSATSGGAGLGFGGSNAASDTTTGTTSLGGKVGSGGTGGGSTPSGGASTGGRSSGNGGNVAGGAGTSLGVGGQGAGGATFGTKVGSGGTTAATGGSSSTGGATGTGGSAVSTSASSVTIQPGAVWNDTQGNVIQAHGEGILQVEGTYYWMGEDKTAGSPFQNIKCYASTDLKNWTFVNNVLTRQPSGDLGPNRIIERPHVIYNSRTSQYVMYMHVDSSNYTDRKAGVATSSSVCGSYSYQGSVKPLGHDSLDDTLFQDGTSGYFISEDRTNTKLQIYKLADDYLTISSLLTSLPQYESPAVVKVGGTYYIFGSHLTGWSTNDNQYSTATSMAGPWSAWKSFAPSGTNTCNSQVTFILPVVGSTTTTYMFLGDRWNPNNLTDSRYIWQPLNINGTVVSMTCATSWKMDATTGALNL